MVDKKVLRRRERDNALTHKIKYETLAEYSLGEIPECQCCGETNLIFLTVDHIRGGGVQHRIKARYHSLTKYLYYHNFPRGYRTLCFNCNFAVQFGDCPHKQNKR